MLSDPDPRRTVFLAAEVGRGGELVVSRQGVQQGAAGAGTFATFQFLAISPGPCDFRFRGASVRDPQAIVLPATFNTALVDVIP